MSTSLAANGLTFLVVDPKTLHPNSWNPNVMSQEDYAKAIESIDRFGFIDPITVRSADDGWEIIDGENRWRVAMERHLDSVPIVAIDADDDEARQLTIVLNELRGKPDEVRLAALVKELASRRPMAELERILPFRRQQLTEMVEARREEIDWEKLKPAPVRPTDAERWVERIFRMPVGAAAVLDDAIARIQASENLEQGWQALELIAANAMAEG